MIRSSYTAITGMKAFQQALAVTSNNIANSQTVGHKSQKAMFEDLFYENSAGRRSNGIYAGSNPISVGNGVKLGSVKTDMTQGVVNYTGGKTDMAIEGDGYFIVGAADGSSWEYTRKGTFRLSEDQRLVNSEGQYVMGWSIDPSTGQLDTSRRPNVIEVPLEKAFQGKQSTEASISGNIDFDMLQGSSSRLQFPVFDSLGKRINVEMEFVKKDNGEYEYVAIPNESFVESENVKGIYFNTRNAYNDMIKGEYVVRVEQDPANVGTGVLISVIAPDGSTVINQQEASNVDQSISLRDANGEFMVIDFKKMEAGAPASVSNITVGEIGTATFDEVGNLLTVVPKGGTASSQSTINFVSPSNGLPIEVNLDLSGLTSFATDTSLKLEGVDGNAAASVRDYMISDDGLVQVLTSDGSVLDIAKIALATFPNAEGLLRNGKGNYSESANSGEVRIAESGLGNTGTIRGSSLENSNVDLSVEFVDLMTYQRSFQANTKNIQVADEVVNSILSLIR